MALDANLIENVIIIKVRVEKNIREVREMTYKNIKNIQSSLTDMR